MAAHKCKWIRLSVPAQVRGEMNAAAATPAWSLSVPSAPGATPDVAGTGPLFNLTAASFANPLLTLILSMVLGAIFFGGTEVLGSPSGERP